jgi:hypothetical protein
MATRHLSEPNTRETLIQLINRLPTRLVAEVLDFTVYMYAKQSSATHQGHEDFWLNKDIATLANEQGAQPVGQEIDRIGFWPEDESVDDFLAAVHEWRQDSPTA